MRQYSILNKQKKHKQLESTKNLDNKYKEKYEKETLNIDITYINSNRMGKTNEFSYGSL